MNFNQDDFLLLLLRQLEDCTSWEEELYIERTLRSNEAARQLLQDVKETFLVKEPHAYYAEDRHFFKDMEINNPLEERTPVKAPVKKKRYFSIAATALLAIVTGASAFFLPASRQQQGPAISDAKRVTLQLANGNVVQLGNTTATISTKSAMLNTNSSMLRFTAKPGSNGWQSNSIIVPPALMYSMALADGSIVHMNAATFVRFPFAFNGKTREVYLEGEAFFNIAPNPHQPFIVHTKKADVTVLGTAFNINTYDDQLTIGLVSGSVVVTSRGARSRTLLTPCKAAIMNVHSNQLSVVDFDSDRILGWLRGQYRFQQEPLRDVCKVAERWYDVSIKIDNEKLAQLTYGGLINKKEPLDAFLKRLKDNGKVAYYFYDWEGVIHLNYKK